MLKLFVAIQSKLAEVRSEEGQTMAEYGVVLAVITLVIVARCSRCRVPSTAPRQRRSGCFGPRSTARGLTRKVVTMSKGIIIKGRGRPDDGRVHGVLGVITIAIVATFSLLSGAINDAFVRTSKPWNQLSDAATEGPDIHEPPPQHHHNERGQTMVEFALVVPILCVVLFGILQFGALYNDYVTLTDASASVRAKPL